MAWRSWFGHAVGTSDCPRMSRSDRGGRWTGSVGRVCFSERRHRCRPPLLALVPGDDRPLRCVLVDTQTRFCCLRLPFDMDPPSRLVGARDTILLAKISQILTNLVSGVN